MASTNKTSHYELSQYVGSDKPTYLTDYNNDMSAIDTGIYNAQTKANDAYTLANTADGKADTGITNAGYAQTDASAALTKIGTLASLDTTAKTDLVSAINEVKDDYDFIIIDCPPSLTSLTENAFSSSNSVLIPMQCEFFSMEVISQLLNTILRVQRTMNNNLQIEGVLLTMCDFRTKIAISVQQEVRQIFKDKVYTFGIPRNIRLVESTYKGRPIIDYDVKCNSAKNYILLAKEVINNK